MTTSIDSTIKLRSKLLRISSRDRLRVSNSTSDFSVNFFAVGDELQNSRGITLMSASIPNVYYNVNKRNQTFSYLLNTGAGLVPSQVILPEGNYNVTEVITALATLIEVQTGGTFDISIVPFSGKLRFTLTGNLNTFSLQGPDSNNMATLLGITELDETESQNVFVSDLPNLKGLSDVFISSDSLSNLTSMIAVNQEISAINNIPIQVPWGITEVYQIENIYTDTIPYERAKNIETIDIKLFDQDFILLDLQGQPVEFVFKIWY